jgi:hypothetical protein
MSKYRSITFQTMQGLGDITWCLQRLYPHFEEAHIRIMYFDEAPLQKRSERLFKTMLPGFVKSCEMIPCTQDEYVYGYSTDFFVKDILDKYKEDAEKAEQTLFTFATNKQLEDGHKLDSLDNGLGFTETLPWEPLPSVVEFPEYAVLYVSGTKMNVKLWNLNEWREYINGIYKKFDITLPLVLTGAEFDRSTLQTLGMFLQTDGFKVGYYIGGDPQQTLDFLKRAKFFVGFQSGLNILCDQFDVPQIMMYFDFLKKLRTAWPKQKNLDNGSHQFFGFDETPSQVVEKTNSPLTYSGARSGELSP